MKNLNLNTKQYAIVKRTLNLEQFIKAYLRTSEIDKKDSQILTMNLKSA